VAAEAVGGWLELLCMVRPVLSVQLPSVNRGETLSQGVWCWWMLWSDVAAGSDIVSTTSWQIA
jgi:hypothetical protein